MNKFKQLAAVAVLGFGVAASAQAIPIAADVIFVVDESGSMGGEHAWMGGMINSLESALVAKNVGVSEQNNYGLVGFGTTSHGGGTYQVAHDHTSGWVDAATASSATSGLTTSGGFEDGWQAIDFALNNYAGRTGDYALNIILVTDEDRDNNPSAPGAGLSYTSVLASVNSAGGVLNAVVNCNFSIDGTAAAIGVDSAGTGYVEDGSGGFNSATGGMQFGGCSGTTKANYVDMAWATGGAAWDLNQLRAGGDTATSFTNAFIDVKVEEIITKVPEPGSLALLGLGLVGMGFAKKRSAQKLAA